MSESREAQPVFELKWEWPGDRAPDVRLVVAVEGLSEEGGGLFGLKRSPSLGDSLPDPVVLRGRVVGGEPGWVGRAVKLRLPRLELPEVRAGDKVDLEVLAGGTCISAAKVPGG
jgi:hypothetical protein